mmetsp:Transcript_66493/g.107926  ORF Transcript_66493/g.107926 Transcript_66493/m.107926 type:complete len:212 (-) Transcript_66493:693-1328(-)
MLTDRTPLIRSVSGLPKSSFNCSAEVGYVRLVTSNAAIVTQHRVSPGHPGNVALTFAGVVYFATELDASGFGFVKPTLISRGLVSSSLVGRLKLSLILKDTLRALTFETGSIRFSTVRDEPRGSKMSGQNPVELAFIFKGVLSLVSALGSSNPSKFKSCIRVGASRCTLNCRDTVMTLLVELGYGLDWPTKLLMILGALMNKGRASPGCAL